MKERTTPQSSTQNREPTYKDSSIGFVDFQEFVVWHRLQCGYGKGYELDADLLRNGNKIYSSSTCLLLPSALNRFLQGNGQAKYRGDLPTGVTLSKCGHKLVVKMRGAVTKLFPIGQKEEAAKAFISLKMMKLQDWIRWVQINQKDIDPRVLEKLSNIQFYHSEKGKLVWKINA